MTTGRTDLRCPPRDRLPDHIRQVAERLIGGRAVAIRVQPAARVHDLDHRTGVVGAGIAPAAAVQPAEQGRQVRRRDDLQRRHQGGLGGILRRHHHAAESGSGSRGR